MTDIAEQQLSSVKQMLDIMDEEAKASDAPRGPLIIPETIGSMKGHQEPHEKATVIASRFKTSPCQTFEIKGKCKYSYHCMFAHGKDDLRSVAQNERDGIITEAAVEQFRKNQRFRQRQEKKESPNASGALANPLETQSTSEKKAPPSFAPAPGKAGTTSAPLPPQYIQPVPTDPSAQYGYMPMMGYGMPNPYLTYFPQMMMPGAMPTLSGATASSATAVAAQPAVTTHEVATSTTSSGNLEKPIDVATEKTEQETPTAAAAAVSQPALAPQAGMFLYPSAPMPMMYMPGAGYVYPQQPYYIPVPMNAYAPYAMPMFAPPQIPAQPQTATPDTKK